jgi:hypothetical protein
VQGLPWKDVVQIDQWDKLIGMLLGSMGSNWIGTTMEYWVGMRKRGVLKFLCAGMSRDFSQLAL